MLSHWKDKNEERRAFRAEEHRRYVMKLDESRKSLADFHWQNGRKPSFETFLEIERKTMVRGAVGKMLSNAFMRRFFGEAVNLIVSGAAPKEGLIDGRLDACFEAMPYVEMFCEVFAARDLNRTEKSTPSHFQDNGIAAVGPAYCHAFVTADGNLFDLVQNRCRSPSKRGCKMLRGLNDLYTYLCSLSG